MRRAAIVLLLAFAGAMQGEAQPAGKYQPAADGHNAYAGRYLVTVSAGEDLVALAPLLAGTYGGRLEPYAREGANEFMVLLSESRARLLSEDGRVVRVAEVSHSRSTPEASAQTATPAGAAVRTPVTNATTSWSFAYSYDDSGNVTAISGDSLRYDKVGRLTTAVVSAHTQNMTYDTFGNIRTITTDGFQLSPGVDGATNRISQRSNGGTTYNAYADYDGAGNVVQYNDSYQYSYDVLNTMKEAAGTGGHEIYVYTADDERIASMTVTGTQMGSGTVTSARWSLRGLDNQVLRVFTKSGTSWAWSKDYVYRNGQMLAAEVPSAEKTLHFHLDHLGTPRLITGNGGAKISKHSYFPFGAEITAASQDTEVKKFTGHERDWQLDYMHARYYNGGPGRFLSVDPLVGQANRPLSWNRYAYSRNSPENFLDPSGMIETAFHCDDQGNCYQEVTQPRSVYTAWDTTKDFIDLMAMDLAEPMGNVLVGLLNDDPKQIALGYGQQFAQAVPGGVASGLTRGVGSSCSMALGLVDDASHAAVPPSRIYSARELIRRAEDTGPYHNFPESFNDEIFSGTRKVFAENYVQYELRGSINGVKGTYEIGVRPALGGRAEVIIHRFFNPGRP